MSWQYLYDDNLTKFRVRDYFNYSRSKIKDFAVESFADYHCGILPENIKVYLEKTVQAENCKVYYVKVKYKLTEV